MVPGIQRQLRQNDLHLGRPGAEVDEDFRFRVLRGGTLKQRLHRLQQNIHIGRIGDIRFLPDYLRTIAIPVLLKIGKGLFNSLIRPVQLRDFPGKKEIDGLRPVEPQNMQHPAIPHSPHGIRRPETGEENFLHDRLLI